MKHSFTFTLALALLMAGPSYAQSKQNPQSRDAQREEIDPDLKPTNEPPRSDSARRGEESSSNDRAVDISPPPNDAKDHPGSADLDIDNANGVMELKPWDPHRADKDLEVGLYYYKDKNYRAAESRYREALYWQDNNAEAHFRLGEALEKLGRTDEAREHFQAYLKILPNGDFAKDARKALDRLAKTEGAKKTSAITSRP